MARRNKRNKQARRDLTTIARRRVLVPRARRLHRSPNLNLIQDARFDVPFSRPMTIHSGFAKIRAKPRVNKTGPSVAFYAPKDAILCARRKRRKEVLFSRGRVGAGNKRPRFNDESMIKCK